MTPAGNGGGVTVIVADDDPTMRAALADLFEEEDAPTLLGIASTTSEAVEMITRLQPSVAVVDVRMPGGGASHVARQVRRTTPRTRIIAFSLHHDRETVVDMLRAGAAGYVLKSARSREILRAVRQVARGGRVISHALTDTLLDELDASLGREEEVQEEETRCREAVLDLLAQRRLEMVFQPIYALERRVVVGAEALARITREPPRGPANWLADAARVGLLPELELLALEEAIAAFRPPRSNIFLSINLSASTIPEAMSRAALRDAAEGIVIEITEHDRIEDYGAVRESLREFRALGGRIAVDDSGAGYANFRHILELSPDFIKLDVSLAAGIESDRSRRALVAGLISFANALGAGVIAEGVETSRQLDVLVGLGVALGQGFHLARPGTVDELPLG